MPYASSAELRSSALLHFCEMEVPVGGTGEHEPALETAESLYRLGRPTSEILRSRIAGRAYCVVKNLKVE